VRVVSERLITDAEAKELLVRRAKEIKLVFEQKNALDHLKKFVRIDLKRAQTLLAELEKVERLRDHEKVAIVNQLPEDRDDLRAVLYKQYTLYSPEEIDQILAAVKKVV
jgi:DNA-directed RNA polymerase subunit F